MRKFCLVLSRDPDCRSCSPGSYHLPGAVWLLHFLFFAGVFTVTAHYFFQRTVSLLWKALHYCHQCVPLGCSVAGQWVPLLVPERSGGPVGVQLLNAAPHVQHQRCRDVHLQSQTWSCYTGSNTKQILFQKKIAHSVVCIFACCCWSLQVLNYLVFFFFSSTGEYFRTSQAAWLQLFLIDSVQTQNQLECSNWIYWPPHNKEFGSQKRGYNSPCI